MLPHRWHKLYKNVLLQLQIFSSHVPTRILTRSVSSQFPQRPIYRHRYWIDLWSLPYKLKLIAAFVLVPNHLLLLCSFGGKIKKKDERSVILFLYQAASEVILLSPTSVSLFVCRAGGGVTCLIYIFTEDIVWCSVSCSDSKSTGTFWSNKNSS